MPYEYHSYPDSNFRVLYNIDGRTMQKPDNRMHWHINPEFLYFLEGKAIVRSDETETTVEAGEIAIISSNRLHTIDALTPSCRYACLIPDSDYCGGITDYPFKCNDPSAISNFENLMEEYSKKEEYYKIAVKGYVAALASNIARSRTEEESAAKTSDKLTSVKAAVEYMYRHFSENITIEDICNEIGLSKYYLCHIFKEAMGVSILNHLNYIRCRKARTMMKSGKYNVSESAYECGFHNLSYFSKTYKEIIGNLPAKDLKNTRTAD